MRCCLLNRVTGTDPLPGQLSTPQSVVPGRRQLTRQDREGLVARLADSAPHPDACAPVIVALTKSPAMANDGVVMANRTTPRQEIQWDYPGSMLSFASGSAIKRITGWREGPPLTVPLRKFRSASRAFTLRQSQFQTKTEYCFCVLTASAPLRTLAGNFRPSGKFVKWPLEIRLRRLHLTINGGEKK